MTSITLTWGQVLALLIGVLAIYGLEMAFFYWRLRRQSFADQMAQLRLQQLEQKIQALQRQLYPDPMPSVPLSPLDGDTVLAQTAPAEAEPEEEEPPAAGPVYTTQEGSTSYNRAIELARTGADASILSRDCGLSRGEADLIVSLYGPRRR